MFPSTHVIRCFGGALLLAVACIGCRDRAKAPADARAGRPYVVATTPMIADLVREIAGTEVVVEALFGATVDPHTYQPVGADIQKLANADAVFFNGLQLEGALMRDLEKLAAQREHVIAVGDSIPAERRLVSSEFADYPDPHIWMDAELWARAVPPIQSTLTKLVPTAEHTFAANATEVTAKLAALDKYIESVIASIPEERRHLVTAHDAFGYFGRAYGIEVSSVQGVSTESEAGLDDVRRLVELVVAKEIPVVFFETSVSERNVTAVVEGAKAAGHDVVLGGELFSDSMAQAGKWEGTYFGMMDHNANMIAAGLGGTVPERGFRGTLADFPSSPEPASTRPTQ